MSESSVRPAAGFSAEEALGARTGASSGNGALTATDAGEAWSSPEPLLDQPPQQQPQATPSQQPRSGGGGDMASGGSSGAGSSGAGSNADLAAASNPDGEVQQLWEQLRQKDAQILVLQQKLAHFRSWVSSLQAKVQASNPQAIKNSKRLYIGGIPEGTTDDEMRSFFATVMLQAGGLVAPGQGVLSCKVCQDKGYAFLEMRSVEEASNAMALDGIQFKDVNLKVRRPSNYDVSAAVMLGPLGPDPTIDTSSLSICRTVVEDSWNKIFVGGLPSDWSDEQVKELLAPFGALKSFNLVMDKVTGKSKGYAFCEFVDEAVTPHVIKSLNLKNLNRKMLTVKRALEGNRQGGGKQHMGAPLGSLQQLPPPPHHMHAHAHHLQAQHIPQHALQQAQPGGGGGSGQLACTAPGMPLRQPLAQGPGGYGPPGSAPEGQGVGSQGRLAGPPALGERGSREGSPGVSTSGASRTGQASPARAGSGGGGGAYVLLGTPTVAAAAAHLGDASAGGPLPSSSSIPGAVGGVPLPSMVPGGGMYQVLSPRPPMPGGPADGFGGGGPSGVHYMPAVGMRPPPGGVALAAQGLPPGSVAPGMGVSGYLPQGYW